MAVCKECQGVGSVPKKDDVWKHLTGRGKPPKMKKCPRCKGRGETSSSGGCFWLSLLAVILGTYFWFS